VDRPPRLGGEAGDGDILVMAMDGVIGHIMVAGEVGVIQSMVAIMVAIHSIQGMVIGLVGEKKSMVSFHKGPAIIRGYLALTWSVILQVVEFLLNGPVKIIKSLWS